LADALLDPAISAVLSTDRRRLADRRTLGWRTFARGSITPRRRGHRRHHESDALVDWHEPHLLFLAIVILLLSVTDAVLTLALLDRGAQEANPLMAYLIEEMPRVFAGVKMGLTGSGLVVLVALARARVFRVIRAAHIIHWCLLGYVVLIAYEASLLRQPPTALAGLM